jgi:DNA-binding beta-propeller fold protein YncE
VRTLLTLGMASLTSVALAGDGDYYLSSPLTGTIWRGDKETGTGEAFATGVLIPHYGHFTPDGTFYVPDRGWPALLKISPTGVVSALSAGGVFDKPVTCIPSLDGQALVVSDGGTDKIIRVDLATGQQTVMFDQTTAGGLFASPDGMAYDDAGNLYVANLTGDNVVKVAPDGTTTVFASYPLISGPGGLAIDGANNLFVANYGASNIVRIRLEDGVGDVFAFDVTKMAHPNDIKLSHARAMSAASIRSATSPSNSMTRISGKSSVCPRRKTRFPAPGAS